MICSNTNECLEQINAYFNSEKTGYFLIVNSEDYDMYKQVLQRLEADTSLKSVYVSKHCYENGLPDVDSAISKVSGSDNYTLIGVSPALMIQSENALSDKIDEMLSYSVSGRAVVLLDHCEQILQSYMRRDLRLQNRVILVTGTSSPLPQIKLWKNADECFGYTPFKGIPKLLSYLEKNVVSKKEISVEAPFPETFFRNAVYSIKSSGSVYDTVIKRCSDLAGSTQKSFGTEEQWQWLAKKLRSSGSFSALVCEYFESTSNLSAHISEVSEESDDNKKWLLWLAMKVFSVSGKKYLTLVLDRSESVDDFEEHIYFDIIDIDVTDPCFKQYYTERKKLIKQLPENIVLQKTYCQKLGKRRKNEIFYLTGESSAERYEFMRCLAVYDYTDDEIRTAAQSMSQLVSAYLNDYVFDPSNTKVPDGCGLREELTAYFNEYKMQKLTNRIYPEFLAKVQEYAVTRPYNILRPRSSIVSHMDKKNSKLFFFDALGVEYLGFIAAECEKLGLVMEVSIGHCELPSITMNNKEFLQYFGDNWVKIDKLDEMKHHSEDYDYRQCEYPIHLFEELDVIDEHLRKIQSQLVQGVMEKAIIVSDHGASRLAVLYGKENDSKIVLDESGEHSGRCCPVDDDPEIDFAAYENGYSTLANYERFKGGRRANVEVHGGASLEEVLVPVITLTKRPEKLEICFVDPVITLRPRIVPTLTMYSNIPLKDPRIVVNGEFITGEFAEDNKHAVFSLPKIKRKGSYHADVYDGNKNLSVRISFTVTKKTQENDIF